MSSIKSCNAVPGAELFARVLAGSIDCDSLFPLVFPPPLLIATFSNTSKNTCLICVIAATVFSLVVISTSNTSNGNIDNVKS